MEYTEALTNIRKKAGYSQKQIADILQTTQQQYSKYETGAQEVPVRHIITLCKLYKVPADLLLGLMDITTGRREQTMTKFEKLYHEVIDIIDHAERNDYISEKGADLLKENLDIAYEDIEIDNKYPWT